jgi:hypothetical protein
MAVKKTTPRKKGRAVKKAVTKRAGQMGASKFSAKKIGRKAGAKVRKTAKARRRTM